MEEVLRFFRTYEVWIYVLLAVFALWQLRKFALAWEELRGALFGMERESAQGRLNQAAVMLMFLLLVAVAEFVLVTFVVPTVPGAFPLPTATLNLLATPAILVTPSMTVIESVAEVTFTPAPPVGEGCVPGQVIITSPADGETIRGEITIVGTADIPNFGFYTYEIARPGETIWLPLQVVREPKRDQELGIWNTASLAPGPYSLRLVVTDNQGIAYPPCIIQVRVVAP